MGRLLSLLLLCAGCTAVGDQYFVERCTKRGFVAASAEFAGCLAEERQIYRATEAAYARQPGL